MSEDTIKAALQQYQPTDAAIAEMGEAYLGLSVKGIEDKDGLKAVHDARMVVKKTRVAVEKTRKELKADALAYGRAVDAEATRIKLLLLPIEDHLAGEEDAVLEEKARLKREAEEQRQAVIRNRVEKLAALGSSLLAFEVERLTHEEYAQVLEEETAAHAERERLAAEAKAKAEAEEAERKAEAERVAEERRKLDAEKAEVAAEKKRLADEEAAREREAKAKQAEQDRKDELERVRVEAEEKAKREAEEAAEREKAEAEARAKAEEEQRLLEERTRPDREKLETLANLVHCADLETPGLPEELVAPVRKILADAGQRILALADALCPAEEEAAA